MFRMTKKYKLDHYDRVERERYMYSVALNAILRGDISWIANTRWIDDCKYSFAIVAPHRGDGGYLVERFQCRNTGQQDQYEVFMLEDKLREACEPLLGSASESRTAYIGALRLVYNKAREAQRRAA